MPDFDDLILSVSGRVAHEFDFAFEKDSGQIANRIRSKLVSGETNPRVPRAVIDIDEDGDISIRAGRPEGSTWYVSASSVTVVGWLTNAGTLRGVQGSDEIGRAIESLYEERRQFRPEQYDVRLFLLARPRPIPENDLSATVSRFCGAAMGNVFTRGLPPRMSSGRVSVDYQKDKFSDSTDLEVSGEGVQLRYIRTGQAKNFGSYGEFLLSANLGEIVEEIRPFAESLGTGASPSK